MVFFILNTQGGNYTSAEENKTISHRFVGYYLHLVDKNKSTHIQA